MTGVFLWFLAVFFHPKPMEGMRKCPGRNIFCSHPWYPSKLAAQRADTQLWVWPAQLMDDLLNPWMAGRWRHTHPWACTKAWLPKKEPLGATLRTSPCVGSPWECEDAVCGWEALRKSTIAWNPWDQSNGNLLLNGKHRFPVIPAFFESQASKLAMGKKNK